MPGICLALTSKRQPGSSVCPLYSNNTQLPGTFYFSQILIQSTQSDKQEMIKSEFQIIQPLVFISLSPALPVFILPIIKHLEMFYFLNIEISIYLLVPLHPFLKIVSILRYRGSFCRSWIHCKHVLCEEIFNVHMVLLSLHTGPTA